MSGSMTREDFDAYLVPCFAPAPFIPVRAAGSRVWDQQGKEYIDMAGGIAVNALGHAHPALAQALQDQLAKLWHIGNGYTNEPVLQLAKTLVQSTFADKVFFCNSGAEANEAALKLARKYAHDKFGGEKSEIIAFNHAFHGRTLFTVSVGGQPKYSSDYAPLPQGITHLPYNDIEAVTAAISSRTCAVIVEPIIGEGGVIPADPAFLQALRTLCDRHHATLIFDEVQTGAGRTGHLYAYQHYNVVPDILTSAKGLGGGFPIGAMLAKEAWAQVFQPGTHGTTFGGNPLAATVANAVLAHLDAPLLAGVGERHALIVDQLNAISARYDAFSAVRGTGLLIGAELAGPLRGKAKTLTNLAAEEGLIALIAGPDVLRFAPALNIPLADIQQGFLFVLEDTALARVVGVSAIEVAVGLDEPFYNFRIQKTVRASKALGVYKPQELLNLSYDHTGHSELCTLFLDPAYQRNRNGLLLSKARFLFIAAFREWFSPHLFAELRGCSDEQGQSPFWDALGHHFFDIPFADADRLTGTGMKTFIAELMPAYPIYISLLPEAARGVIGQVHPNTAPARAILEKEGFSWRGSVDIFDAGPVLEADTDQIRAVRDSQRLPVRQLMGDLPAPTLVANGQFDNFRALLVAHEEQVSLDSAALDALQVSETDRVYTVTLNPEDNRSWR